MEGDREQQVFDATLDVLADVGYDRLTMDAVASAARASKATLYRRWAGKAELVIEALLSQKGPPEAADTGTLRGDLLGTFCGAGALTDERMTSLLASLITAIARDEDFAEAFRTQFIGPKSRMTAEVFTRARARGEIDDGVDLELLAMALPAVVLHRQFLLGCSPDTDFITGVVDQIILPACTPKAGRTPAPLPL